MRKKRLQQSLAAVLSAAMLLTGVSFPGMTAKAAESPVYTDDMEAAAEGWTVSWQKTDAQGEVTNERKVASGSNNGWNLWTQSAQKVTLSKRIEGKGAGNFKASVQGMGGNINSGSISISAGEAETEIGTAAMEFGAWGDWKTSATELCAAQDEVLTIKIEVDLKDDGWFWLDNVVLAKELSDQQQIQEKKTELKSLLDACAALKDTDYQPSGWSDLQTAIADAQTVYDNESAALQEITDAIASVQAAKDALVPAGMVEDAGVFVKKVEGLSEDFVRGVDISTYASLIESGVKFKGWNGEELDEAGFFKLLKDAGVNYVRIRVWNDPYADAEKTKGYGAGNCDVDKAARMGKWATDAGIRVMIDFHYSDFWADPGRQVTPKAWKDYSADQKAEAVSAFTTESLNEIRAAGVDVGMVQVGNETTKAICGEEDWANMAKIFKAGCEAVKAVDQNILTVIHFTNPEKASVMKGLAKNLSDNNVEYDVFASSFYPYWHGTGKNLTEVLKYVADTYHKKVMVAETSWASTMKDGDGQPNVVRPGQNDDTSVYAATPQGQANEVRDVIEAVANIGEAGLGMMYWEPAWIPLHVYDPEAENAEEILAANRQAWETYGTGWASRHSIAYDPNVTEKNYGGSEWDNQAMFDFNGNPLPSLNVYKLVYTGATAKKKLDSITAPSIDVGFGEDAASKLPQTVQGMYNDGSKAENLAVSWNQADVDAIEGFGTFFVKGTVSYKVEGAADETMEVICTLNILPENILEQGDFEAGRDKWTIDGTGLNPKATENPRSGEKCVAFYLANPYELIVSQSVTVEKPGTFSAFMYLQGGDDEDAVSGIIKLSNDTSKDFKEASASAKGWKVWQNPITDEVRASKGDTLTVTITINGKAKSWGSIDDVYLYQKTEASVYKVTYHLNEGVNAQTNPVEFDGFKAIALADPSREGYTFEGWYTDSEFKNQVTEIAEGTNENLELYAKWEPVVVAPGESLITYYLNGGSNHADNPSKYTEGQAVELKDPSREGYVFKGWYTDSEYENEFAGITAETSGNLQLYAKWEKEPDGPGEPEEYTIQYELNGGSNHADNPSKYTEGQAIELKDPSREGYVFKGWYTDSEYKNEFAGITAETSGNLQLYAKWESKQQTGDQTQTKVSEIRLDASAKQIMRNQTFTLKATVLPESASNKDLEWATSDPRVATVNNGVVTAAGPGEAVITASAKDGSGKKASCTVTVPYSITYNLNKGSNHKDNPAFYYNQKVSLKNPVRKGYLFGGWYADSKFKTKMSVIAQNSKKDITLYAKWNKVTVKKASIKKVTNASKKAAKVSIKKVSGAKGYQVLYATSKNFKKGVKKTFTKKTSLTIKKLKKGKTYYVKVRAYKLDSRGEKVYGSYSKVKKVKIRK